VCQRIARYDGASLVRTDGSPDLVPIPLCPVSKYDDPVELSVLLYANEYMTTDSCKPSMSSKGHLKSMVAMIVVVCYHMNNFF